MKGQSRSARILLVDDNPGDVLLISEALAEFRAIATLDVAIDGVEAMEFLRRQGRFLDKPRPDIILLDLELPRKGGKEVLAEVKNDDELKLIPIIVLSSSNAPQDVVRSYSLHANCYVVKPFHLDDLTNTVKSIVTFWLTVVRLPEALNGTYQSSADRG